MQHIYVLPKYKIEIERSPFLLLRAFAFIVLASYINSGIFYISYKMWLGMVRDPISVLCEPLDLISDLNGNDTQIYGISPAPAT